MIITGPPIFYTYHRRYTHTESIYLLLASPEAKQQKIKIKPIAYYAIDLKGIESNFPRKWGSTAWSDVLISQLVEKPRKCKA